MRYAALLRGINVGGNTKVKMETLREMCEALGFKNVKTYINSGNVAFDTRKSDNRKLAAKIVKAIEKEFAISISVMVRSLREIEQVIKNNPFAGEFESEKEMHVLFLEQEMPAEKIKQLLANNSEKERFSVIGPEIYCHLRNGVIDSILGKDYIGKKLKVAATARNWRTVNKIAAL
ncbi:MAG: DUF1697 domain-containing protein [Pyrinomonadaceae bacterium]